jgi:hypothetical protein
MATRCESKASKEIPKAARLVRRFKKGRMNCETRRQGRRQWTRCTMNRGTVRVASRTLRTYNRGLQKCTVTKKGAVTHTSCAWGGIMKGARITRRYRSGKNICAIWRAPKAARRVCSAASTTVVKRYRNKSGAICTVYRRGNASW